MYTYIHIHIYIYVTGFAKTCIAHTSDFAHLKIHKNYRQWNTDLKLTGMIQEEWFYKHKNVTHVYHFKFILWVTRVEKLDLWTMHIYSNPVTCTHIHIYIYTYIHISRWVVVSCEAKKKQHAWASSGQCNHYSELFTWMVGLNF